MKRKSCANLTSAVLFVASLAATVSLPVMAADTPGGPTVNERLTAARKSIDAKDWSKAMF